jgi:acyl dehydratase
VSWKINEPMSLDSKKTFRSLPSMVLNYARVISSSKPYLAPDGAPRGKVYFEALNVAPTAGHIKRYRKVCAIPDSPYLPHAFPHVLAMPLHMHIFTAPGFPVKVLGLIHLRNTIRAFHSIPINACLRLSAEWEVMRETPVGQEYDLITRAYVGEQLMWEEVSTMLAHRAAPGQRPKIERAGDTEIKTNFAVSGDTGRRYAMVSGDFNPIHLFARTAAWFGFKQAVAHGMWSMSRALGEGAAQLPNEPIQIDTQFKLPLYLPSEVIFRSQRNDKRVDFSLSSAKGDRMHLAVQVFRL